MSSESDAVVFEEALEPQDNTTLFQSKRWAVITDNSSNGGTFNGQLQFNLNTLANLNQWSALSQSLVTFPVCLNINHSAIALTGPNTVNMLAAGIKNGFHQFVDSVQITVGGTTIQNAQIFENVNTTFKMLSEWSVDEYRKWGPSLGISLDDYQLSVDATAATYAATTYDGLDNVAIGTSVVAPKGFNIPSNRNPGFKERAQNLNSIIATSTANSILVNPAALGKGRVYTAAQPDVGADTFTMMALATVRLGDVSDVISKLPPMKSLKGFIYLNYNAGKYTLSSSDAGVPIVGMQSIKFGHTMPAMLGSFVAGTAATSAVTTFDFTADVSGVALNGCTVAQQNARLYVPYYVANPTIDKALSLKKTLRYNERFQTSFTIDQQGNANITLSPGITNPKRIVLLPLLIGDSGNAAGLTTLSTTPETNVWSHEPAGSSPFAAITGLQFIVGGVPMFQTPTTMDWESFQTELTQMGNNGGLEPQEASGLLNQRLWNQLYRFYTCDISRRIASDDGSTKSVIVQLTNATKAKMKVLAFIWYEREIEVDTVMGDITQGF
jgi:hypothetical protein